MRPAAGPPEEACIFCEIARGAAPCHRVWEDGDHMAFLSIFPNTEGLTVVIPKRHLSSYIFDHPPDAVAALMEAARQVSALLVAKFPTVARAAVVFEGYGVDHLHAKLIPLHGTRAERWEPIRSTLRTRFRAYPGYVSSHDAERETDERLAEIADLLKN